MKTFLIFIFSCVSVLGADTGVRPTTTIKTNSSGGIVTKDVYTRDGKTNLVRNTLVKAGELKISILRFYCEGKRVAELVVDQNSCGFTTVEASPYSAGLTLDAQKEPASVVIGKDGVVFEAFMATNGVFYPVDLAVIKKANAVGADVSKLLSPSQATNTSPEKFYKEVEKLIEKHKGNN